jgi:DNA repair protein RecN (Recombination protein N)
MLLELSITNYALIEDLALELAPGLCVLTGETGAGKSIIIGALSAALGERVSVEVVRGGADEARIEAIFEVAGDVRVLEALADAGIEPEEDGQLVLARSVGANGRSRSWINGRPAALSVLRRVGDQLVDIHGQHEHQALIREETHVNFLDGYGGEGHLQLWKAYWHAYQQVQQTRRELEGLRLDEREKAQRLDLLRFQVGEIDEAKLSAEEERELTAERRRLANAEKLHALAASARGYLAADESEALGAREGLAAAQQDVAQLAALDDDLKPLQEQLTGAVAVVDEAARELAAYLARVEFNPERLEQVEARLNEYARLKRKYGDTVADVLALRDRAAAQLDAIQTSEQRLRELEQQLAEQQRRAGEAGEALSAARRTLAAKLQRAVVAELRTLGMPKARFVVQVERTPDPEGLPAADGSVVAATETGLDQVRFLFSANPGEEPRPLAKVASGGELSRVMLVFKSICSRAGEIPTLIFDEIDAGIGADTGLVVGQRLAQVSRRAQVLCVTHLPQIARMADLHLRVDKRQARGRTVISVQALQGEARVSEIARMLGGTQAAASAADHALQLLASAEREKAPAS